MEPSTISTYVRALSKVLPPEVFANRPRRLIWLLVHGAVSAAGIIAIARGWGGLWAAPLFALVIGHSFACMAFVGHETLHGSVVRGSRARHLVGWVALLPFMISPRLWVVWHNKVHHGNATHPDIDPDIYPSLAQYRSSRALRVLDRLSLGLDHPAGVASLIFGLTVQSLHCLFRVGGQRQYMSRREQLLAIGETLAGVAGWTALGIALGPLAFLFAFVIPLLVANAVVMAYILTNHGLSPYTKLNDPLLNSLSVTTPRVIAVLHLNFGYHVEHHMFPRMSPANAPLLRRLLMQRWPERYQSMPLWRALYLLAHTPRIHLTPETLIDPRTGRTFATLLPRV